MLAEALELIVALESALAEVLELVEKFSEKYLIQNFANYQQVVAG
ncbi:hypothetical protein [Candidatus Minimicrobia naudis]